MSEPEQANPTALTDEQLARRVQAGCEASYDELDRRYRPRLIGLLRRRTAHDHDAEDLAQQALWRAYDNIARYDPRRPFRAWLYTVAVRLAIDAARARKPDRAGASPPPGEVADPAPSPIERAIRKEQSTRLWQTAAAVLDEAQHTALWLHYVEQLPAKQIGEVLGRSAVHTRVTLHRARKLLADHLQPEAPEAASPAAPSAGPVPEVTSC